MNSSRASPFFAPRRYRNTVVNAARVQNQFLCGYEVEFVDTVDEDLECGICKLPLRTPVQTSCGHRFCKGCLDQHFKSQTQRGQQPSCPFDREKLSREKDVFSDRATERKVQSLKVKCENNCGLTFELRNRNEHKKRCPKEVVSCTNNNCKETMPRKDLEVHVNITCPWRLLSCVHCGMNHPACHRKDHQQKCKRFPEICPNGCGGTFPREQIKAHTDKDCPHAIVCCPYTKLGCTTKVRRGDVSDHLQSATNGHLDLACVKLLKTYEEHEKLKQENEKFKETIKRLEQMLNNTRKEYESLLKETTRNLEKKIDDLQKFNSSPSQRKLEREIEVMKGQLETKINRTETSNMIDGRLREKEKGVNSMWPNRVEAKFQDNLSQMKYDLKRLRNKINSLENKVYRDMEDVANRKLNELHQTIQNVEGKLNRNIERQCMAVEQRTSQQPSQRQLQFGMMMATTPVCPMPFAMPFMSCSMPFR